MQCGTYGSLNAIRELPLPDGEFRRTTEPVYLKIYIHATRQLNGAGGVDDADVHIGMANLESAFRPHNIFFIWDCFINPIPLGEADYLDPRLYCPLWTDTTLRHNDGIDIFIGAPETPDDSKENIAEDIPSTALWMTGINNGTGEHNITTPNFPHEVGHCLGLWHTFHGTYFEPGDSNCVNQFVIDTFQCCELVNGDSLNKATCGDFVADTGADPHPHWFSLPRACAPVQRLDDPRGLSLCHHPSTFLNPPYRDMDSVLYSPTVNNFMSYNNVEDCRKAFTMGQGERMLNIIAMNTALQNCVIGAGNAADQIITTTQTWTASGNPNIIFNGNLIINPGVTLTIEDGVTVGFSKGNRLIVSPGATLELDGVLTGMGCPDVVSTWEGVEVWGTASTNQQIGGQGQLFCYDNAVIENANIGVKLYEPGGFPGGIIRASRSTFKNNQIGVDFNPYQSVSIFGGGPANYNALFVECEFITDDDYFIGTPFRFHVRMANVSGVRFLGCHFKNEQANTVIRPVGRGIMAFDAGFEVKPKCIDPECNEYEGSVFEGLLTGVHAVAGKTVKPFEVRLAEFTRCANGIHNNGVQGSVITLNMFNMGDLKVRENSPTFQMGILYESEIMGLTCQENTFQDVFGQASVGVSSIGILALNTGQTTKDIRRNTFDGLNQGNVALLDNGSPSIITPRGLRYLCNADSLLRKDYEVNFGNIRSKQRIEDFSGGNVSFIATGNKFAYTGIDFENNVLSNIEYFYNPIGMNEQPINTSGDFTPSIGDPNTCPAEYCNPPCGGGFQFDFLSLKSGYYTALSAYDSIVGTITGEPTEEQTGLLGYYQTTMDNNVRQVLEYYMTDTTAFHHDSLLVWIPKFNSFESGLWLAREYMGINDSTTALQILNNLPSELTLTLEQSTDLTNYTALYNFLAGHNIYALDTTALAVLETYDSIGGHAQSRARGVLAYYGYLYEPEVLTGGQERKVIKPITHAPLPKAVVLVHPNPAKNYVIFDLPDQVLEQKNTILIKDMTGRTVASLNTGRGQNSATWLTADSVSGIYYFQVLSDKKLIHAGKFIVEK